MSRKVSISKSNYASFPTERVSNFLPKLHILRWINSKNGWTRYFKVAQSPKSNSFLTFLYLVDNSSINKSNFINIKNNLQHWPLCLKKFNSFKYEVFFIFIFCMRYAILLKLFIANHYPKQNKNQINGCCHRLSKQVEKRNNLSKRSVGYAI